MNNMLSKGEGRKVQGYKVKVDEGCFHPLINNPPTAVGGEYS
jgi:hypothetical protein